MFTRYVDSLERLAFAGVPARDPAIAQFIKAALDGGPSDELSKTEPISNRRAAGSFFTGSAVARRMIGPWRGASSAAFTYLDPACGAGDLLLAAADHLPILETLPATLDLWATHLVGYDLDPRFVAATKARLILLARSKIPNSHHTPLSAALDHFPGIVVADGLTQQLSQPTTTIRLLMNPPFTLTQASPRCTWGGGSISTAARFVDYWIHHLSPGSELVAILPDVLRSGSRYERWRTTVETHATILLCESLKRFSPNINVDVFLLSLGIATQHSGPADWWPRSTASRTVNHFFDVKVGPVVPHRHHECGPSRPFATTSDLPIGRTVRHLSTSRRFSGTLFRGPFLTVRRTSRPGDRRCRATLVLDPRSIAVENHLLVLLPRHSSLTYCYRALHQLNSSKTDEWLDRRIRCRHLTVSAAGSIPIELEDSDQCHSTGASTTKT